MKNNNLRINAMPCAATEADEEAFSSLTRRSCITDPIASINRPTLPLPPALSVSSQLPSRSWYSVSLPSISALTAEVNPQGQLYMRLGPSNPGRKRPSSTFASHEYETTPSPTSSVDMESYLQVQRPGLRRMHSLENYRTPYSREQQSSSIRTVSGKPDDHPPLLSINALRSQRASLSSSISSRSPAFPSTPQLTVQPSNMPSSFRCPPLPPIEPGAKNTSFSTSLFPSAKGGLPTDDDDNPLQGRPKSNDFVDEKRKRNATASARFRLRRKEREREMAARIAQLEEDLKKVSEERDKWKGTAQSQMGSSQSRMDTS
ncbi:Regulatory protein cys-3 [Neolecta irregularis DAH-3]|uniref:Regulatory protein cys-3 n=1 Tax=Neolecta irregularis (strain DAH-3) TaxID=1198029 RepID=A0A1U7LQS9_NEOID|nr:Regulatory protein cys-3 [Neolecta irregularis DAH-3]|eukprot:OLL25015.1 Regulatory protein cys-3 [Neolecta irregularis DAH-3]